VLVIAAVVAGGAVSPRALPKVIVGILVIASVGYFAVMLLGPQVQSVERARLRAFVPLCIGNAACWSLFSQVFTTLTAYSKEWMDGSCLGSIANPARISSMEPIGTLPLSPLIAVSWTKLGERALRTPRKFAGGGTGMGGAFLLFLTMAGGTGRSGPVLAVSGILALIAVSELLLSPIGLSVSTEPGAGRPSAPSCTRPSTSSATSARTAPS
jgi:POT family proton-dependent oligopeptide transporter